MSNSFKIHASENETINITEHDTSTFIEYPLSFNRMSVGVSEINGTYPESGYDIDLKCEAVWYVISGTGSVTIDDSAYELKAGDMVQIKEGKKIKITGTNLKLVVVSSPPWSQAQHIHID